MKSLRLNSIAAQVVAHLRGEIESGSLAGEMPGAKKLGAVIGINHKTVEAAVQILEQQGLLESQGPGKPRRIITPKSRSRRSLRVALLTYEPDDTQLNVITDLRHTLINEGHTCLLSNKSQMELRWDVNRIAQMVRKTKADAWILQSSPRPVLEWFVEQPMPFIALHGRHLGLPIAVSGINMTSAVTEAIEHLVSLGHRRIVVLAQESDLIPPLGSFYRTFLDQLEIHGIETSSYNLPHWDSSPDGMHKSLDALFQLTPPTAIFVSDVALFFPTYLHLLRRGIRIPEDVSLISTDFHPQFNWCVPPVSHFNWNPRDVILRILRWANNTAMGKEDLKKKTLEASFVAKGTTGPAPGFSAKK